MKPWSLKSEMTETSNPFLTIAFLLSRCVPVLIGLASRWDQKASDPELPAAFREVCELLRAASSALDSFEG